MKLKQADKDLITGGVLLVISLLAYTQIAKIKVTGEFIKSAALLPLCVNVLFTVLSIALIMTSVKKGGRINFSQIGAVAKAGMKTRTFRIIVTAMVSIAVLIFIGVRYIGFFVYGGIFMFCILLFFVKSIKPIYSVLITAATLAVIYGIFIALFKIPLK